jgi:hypothetical protein
MLSYHNDISIKEKYVKRMQDHIAADELIRGVGFESGRGCAVGCTLNNYAHSQYPVELGIPEWLARLEDRLFENMSKKKSKTFPLLFLEAIKPGVDLEKIKAPFLIFILQSVLTKFDHEKFPAITSSIDDVIALYESGETDVEKFRAARRSAAAADAAAYAYAVAYAAVADAAAAYAAAAAGAAYAAAAAAAYADAAADAAAYAAAARTNEYDKFADKLLELLSAAE